MKKYDRTHNLLKETAVSLFLDKRSSHVSLDEIAETASIARRTLFNHFVSKEALVLEIASPILMDGLNYLNELNRWDQIQLDHLVNLFLYLWNRHGRSLNLLYMIDFEDFNDVKQLHNKYLISYFNVIDKIEDWPLSLRKNKKEIAGILFRVFVPLLNGLSNMPNWEKRFTNALKGIISGAGDVGI